MDFWNQRSLRCPPANSDLYQKQTSFWCNTQWVLPVDSTHLLRYLQSLPPAIDKVAAGETQALWATPTPLLLLSLRDASEWPQHHGIKWCYSVPSGPPPLKIDGSSKNFTPEERRQRWPLWMKEGCRTTFLLALHRWHLPSCYPAHICCTQALGPVFTGEWTGQSTVSRVGSSSPTQPSVS